MSRFLQAPSQLVAVGLFAFTGLAAANPMASFVDCNDSFWAVACGNEVPAHPVDLPADAPTIGSADLVPEEPQTMIIDNDPTCTEIDGGAFIYCHT